MSSSRSDGSSSSSRRCSASPVSYRVGPLGYQPAVMCRCRCPAKATWWISWSIDNPGRRYYKCQNARELLNDLRDAVTGLRRENEHLRRENKDLQRDAEENRAKRVEQRKAIQDASRVDALKTKEIRILKTRNQKLEKERNVVVVFMLSGMFVLFVLLFGKN
uniref:Zinc finger GRF-type domain-containing protein n=1 Tax=Oryza barthii TaxID=65489 RepID=A0A0D3GET7_9ORYZ